jgi:hypothetical protein
LLYRITDSLAPSGKHSGHIIPVFHQGAGVATDPVRVREAETRVREAETKAHEAEAKTREIAEA